MSTARDRRAPEISRIPFDAMVEVGGTLGPTFEAQAVNLSEEGMQLRTAYLPEVGQPITCRFDAGQGLGVVAAGEVLWKEDMGDGGEFGIRFTNLDGASTVALQRIVGMGEEGLLPRSMQGRKVRLHIEGLASPMRARVRGTQASCVTAYSELGFLQVGKPLELEDAVSGGRRPAHIDRVEVQVDPETRIPQLVVTLRYDDDEGRAAEMANADHANQEITGRDAAEVAPSAHDTYEMNDSHDGNDSHEDQQYAEGGMKMDEPVVTYDSDIDAPEGGEDKPNASRETIEAAPATAKAAPPVEGEDEESKKLKSPFARNAAKVGPALTAWALKTKAKIALMAAKRGGSGDDVEIPIRRTTAPAPGGGLHAAGRKILRGGHEDKLQEKADDTSKDTIATIKGVKITKKKAMIGGGIGLATILLAFAMHKPAPPAQLASAPPAPVEAAPIPVTSPAALPAANEPDPLLANAGAGGGAMLGADPSMAPAGKLKNGKPAPFTNGPVGAHGNVIKVKTDGPIGSILGASEPTGFTVVLPGRKSLDAAGPIAAKDGRIANIHVGNEPNGAAFTVAFKDGVPNYVVRAKGDTLEIVLAKSGASAGSNGDRPAEAHASKKKHGKKR